MPYESAGTIVNDAARELGLGTSDDPWQSSDPDFQKLVGYMKSGGRKVVLEHEWEALTNEALIVTVLGQESYPLPADFRSMIVQSGWDRTTRTPLGGPFDASEWQYMKAIQSGVLWTVYVRFKQGKIWVSGGAQVPGGHTIAFEYASIFFAGAANTTLPPTKEYPTAKDDVVFLDSNLMSRMLKHEWASNNGYGDLHKGDLDAVLEKAKNADSGARPVLRLHRRRRDDLISTRNLPPSGYGQ